MGSSVNTLEQLEMSEHDICDMICMIAKYGCLVWYRSRNISKVDIHLNDSIFRTVKSTPNAPLPLFCNVAPPPFRSSALAKNKLEKLKFGICSESLIAH